MSDLPSYEEWVNSFFNYEWWDYVFENFKSECEEIGIEVDDIAFDLGYCQSDYAGFDGSIQDFQKFIARHPAPNYVINDAIANGYISFSWKMRDRVRSDSFDFSVYTSSLSEFVLTDGLCAGMTEQQFDELLNSPEVDLWEYEDELRQIVKAMATDLYYQLRNEYENLSSEESYNEWVKEEIANAISNKPNSSVP